MNHDSRSHAHNHEHPHPASASGGQGEAHHHSTSDFKNRFFAALLLTAPVLALSSGGHFSLGIELDLPYQSQFLFVISTLIYFYGGWPFLRGWIGEFRERRPGMMTLIGLAISVAYVYSAATVFGLSGDAFFWELATLIDIMLLGHWIEMKSASGASRALEKLVQLLPDSAHLVEAGGVRDLASAQIQKGMRLLVKAGEKIPADGLVVLGATLVDESLLTGESKPVVRNIGDRVIAGSLNGDAAIEIVARGAGADSYLQKVVTLVRNAQASRSNTQKLADRAANWLTLIALGGGLASFIYWLIYGPDLAFAIERMATVMVVACPHALGLAIPLVNAVSTALSARNGLLIRNRSAFENARKITTLVFDKTGTLTEGKFGVSSALSFLPEVSETRILELAASIEVQSEHLIARSIVDAARRSDLPLHAISNFTVLKGEGVQAEIAGQLIRLVSENYLRSRGIPAPGKQNAQATAVYVLFDNAPAGLILLADQLRPESKEAIGELQTAGLQCWMITGDNRAAAESVSRALDLDGVLAEVMPHEKLEKIQDLQKGGAFVAMIGDGINDAPALAQANIGIAIGSGTDVAAETADIILVNSDPRDVSTLIRFGRATYAKMLQNLFWATAYNAVAIPLAAGVLQSQGLSLSPAAGAALMSLSTVIVAINAQLLRLRRR